MVKDRRYYLAVDIAQYIVEGHSKREASQEFKIANRTIDRYLDSLQFSNEALYLKTKKALASTVVVVLLKYVTTLLKVIPKAKQQSTLICPLT